jgi:hypothetical protein
VTRPTARTLSLQGMNTVASPWAWEKIALENMPPAEPVEAGKLDLALGIFKSMPDVKREPFFRFSLMVARPAKTPERTRGQSCRAE